MLCSLCHQYRDLSDSHIVPEFMYKGLYDPNHTFFTLNRDPQVANRTFRKGLREKLLCSDCELRFSKWESYAAQFFYGGKITPRIEGELFFFERIKYAELKLFFLSLLWRFAVTTIPSFQGVKLIDKHKEKLRLMLLNANPGIATDFPCFIQVVTHEGKFFGQFIMPPTGAKYRAHHAWQFCIAGFHFTFFVSSHAATDMDKAFLSLDGKVIFMATEWRKIPALYDFSLELGKASLTRKQIPKSKLKW